MSSTECKQLHKDFGLMVTGLSLKDDLSNIEVLQIKEWIDEHNVFYSLFLGMTGFVFC